MIEETPIASTDRVMILHANDPALAVAIGRQAAETVVYDASVSTLDRVRQQVRVRGVPNVEVRSDVFPSESAAFDVALLPVPKGRELARGLLWSAHQALRPGGKLYIGGATDGGTKTLIADAAVLFGKSGTVAYRHHQRLGLAVQPNEISAYPAEWGENPTHLQTRQLAELDGLTVHTMPGVFSWDHLDDGTALLIEHMAINAGERVLDMGCGYGVIGVIAAQRGAGDVMLIDDSLLAIRCAQATVEAHGLTNAAVLAGDLFEPLNGSDTPQLFDLIVSNPPFHQKFDVNTNVAHRLMRELKAALNPGGRLLIVANAFLKYETVMQETFTSVRKLIDTNRYVVLEARRG